MKKLTLLLTIALQLVVMQMSAQLLIDAEDASFDSKKYLIDNGNTYKLSRDGMINETGAIWDQELYNSNDCFITSEESRAGGHSMEYYIRPTSADREKQRIEHYYQQNYNYSDGLEHYTGFSIRLDGDAWDNPTDWFNISQMMQLPGGRAPVLLHIDDDGSNTLAMRFYYGPNSDGRIGQTFNVRQLAKDVWYDIVIGYKWSPNSTNGFMYVWIKTANETEYTRTGISNTRVGFADQPQESWFSAVGIYRARNNNTNRLYVDELRFSNSFDGARIPNGNTNIDPIVSFASPSNGQFFDAPASIDVTVNASDADGSIANVKLYLDGTFVRQENIYPYEWNNDALLNNLAVGTYTLSAVATDNSGNTGEQSITITIEDDNIPVSGVSVSPTSISLDEGQTRDLTETVSPSNATNKSVTWSSSNTSVATVNSSGLVSAISAGNATISVRTVDQNKTASCAVNVTSVPSGVTNLALNKSVTASSEPQADNPASNTVDGSTSTRWSAVGMPQWLEVDLGDVYSISRTEVVCYIDRAYQFVVESKTSASGSYSQIVNRSNNTQGGTVSNPITDNFGSVDARYVRITISDAASYTGSWVSLLEFRVFGEETNGGSAPVTTTLSPIHDAYLQGSTNYNNTLLRIEEGNRVGYLMYDLSSINGNITEAKLNLTCNSDAGNGNININLGNSNNWTESNLSTSNAPSAGALLGSLNTTYSIGTTYTWNLNASAINGGGNVSLVVASTGGNDAAFASKENSATSPQLEVTYEPLKNAKGEIMLSKNSLDKVTAYPNPFNNHITVDFNNANILQVNLLNVKGGVVYQNNQIENASSIIVPMDNIDINSGLYFLQLVSDTQVKTIKLIKQ